MASPPPSNLRRGGIAAAAVAAMVAIATPIYVGWEGNEPMPYRDIVGVWTVCSGDTRNVVPGRRLSQAECDARTSRIMEEYGAAVARLSPGIANSPYEWSAHTIFAANVGVGAYERSSVRRLYNAGRHRAACRFLREYRKAGGRVVQGLINRREGTDHLPGEYELCLVGAIPADAGASQ